MTAQTPAPGMSSPLPGAGTNWRERSVCASVDPDLWFPDPGSSSAAAKRVCLGCEVRTDCLEYALEHGERGIWGGTTENQRRAIRRARDPKKAAA